MSANQNTVFKKIYGIGKSEEINWSKEPVSIKSDRENSESDILDDIPLSDFEYLLEDETNSRRLALYHVLTIINARIHHLQIRKDYFENPKRTVLENFKITYDCYDIPFWIVPRIIPNIEERSLFLSEKIEELGQYNNFDKAYYIKLRNFLTVHIKIGDEEECFDALYFIIKSYVAEVCREADKEMADQRLGMLELENEMKDRILNSSQKDGKAKKARKFSEFSVVDPVTGKKIVFYEKPRLPENKKFETAYFNEMLNILKPCISSNFDAFEKRIIEPNAEVVVGRKKQEQVKDWSKTVLNKLKDDIAFIDNMINKFPSGLKNDIWFKKFNDEFLELLDTFGSLAFYSLSKRFENELLQIFTPAYIFEVRLLERRTFSLRHKGLEKKRQLEKEALALKELEARKILASNPIVEKAMVAGTADIHSGMTDASKPSGLENASETSIIASGTAASGAPLGSHTVENDALDDSKDKKTEEAQQVEANLLSQFSNFRLQKSDKSRKSFGHVHSKKPSTSKMDIRDTKINAEKAKEQVISEKELQQQLRVLFEGLNNQQKETFKNLFDLNQSSQNNDITFEELRSLIQGTKEAGNIIGGLKGSVSESGGGSHFTCKLPHTKMQWQISTRIILGREVLGYIDVPLVTDGNFKSHGHAHTNGVLGDFQRHFAIQLFTEAGITPDRLKLAGISFNQKKPSKK